MHKLIDSIDNIGNIFIDDVIIPLAKGSKNIVLDDNKIFKSFLTLKTSFIENKIYLFLKYIQNENIDDIVSFINNLKDNEKRYFIETINKIMDSDDSFQIYALSQLVIRFNKNGLLNYWEKALYYNIKLFSKDDFYILYEFIEALIKPIQYKVIYGTSKDSSDEVNLSIKKFELIGVISLYNGEFAPSCINLEKKHECSIAFSFYPFITDLFEIINSYKNMS